MNKSLKQTGFTIVELLVVIVVIGILAAVTVIAFNGVARKASVAGIQSDLRGAFTSIQASFIETETYPASKTGIPKSDSTFYEYTQTATSFCLTATSTRSGGVPSYYISNTQTSPVQGLCPGHTGDVNPIVYTPPTGISSAFVGPLSYNDGNVDGTGTDVRFRGVGGIVMGNDGYLYVIDNGNNSIRKVSSAGVVTTLAGDGAGYVDGQGTAAKFNDPRNLAIAADGTLYVADTGNHVIRKITPAGAVTTFAGTGTVSGLVDATGSNARFYRPMGIAVTSTGTVYVGDNNNHSIRKITPAGEVTTLMGSPWYYGLVDGNVSTAQVNTPYDIAVSADGTLYVVDTYNHAIRKITPAGVVSTLAGTTTYGSTNGTGSAARFYYPSGLTVAADGMIYVADQGNNLVRKITPAGVVTTLAGSTGGNSEGTGTAALFSGPADIASAPDGTLYVTDAYNLRIRTIK